MPRQEWLIRLAKALQRLQFRCDIQLAVRIVADVERNDADGITGNQKLVLLLVVEGEGENAVEFLQELYAPVAVEGENHLAVAARLELVAPGISDADVPMVVYLAVHRKNLLAVGRIERLPATFRIDDGQTLMSQNGTPAHVDSAPVRTTVAYFLRHAQCLLTQLRCLLLDVEYSYNAAHRLLMF